jgi:hypothetical protein
MLGVFTGLLCLSVAILFLLQNTHLEQAVSGQTACPGHFTAREKVVVFVEFGAGWVLELVWVFWRKNNTVAADKIRTPELPLYIPVTVLSVLHHADFKTIPDGTSIN